jgi:hypothetical protein
VRDSTGRPLGISVGSRSGSGDSGSGVASHSPKDADGYELTPPPHWGADAAIDSAHNGSAAVTVEDVVQFRNLPARESGGFAKHTRRQSTYEVEATYTASQAPPPPLTPRKDSFTNGGSGDGADFDGRGVGAGASGSNSRNPSTAAATCGVCSRAVGIIAPLADRRPPLERVCNGCSARWYPSHAQPLYGCPTACAAVGSIPRCGWTLCEGCVLLAASTSRLPLPPPTVGYANVPTSAPATVGSALPTALSHAVNTLSRNKGRRGGGGGVSVGANTHHRQDCDYSEPHHIYNVAGDAPKALVGATTGWNSAVGGQGTAASAMILPPRMHPPTSQPGRAALVTPITFKANSDDAIYGPIINTDV